VGAARNRQNRALTNVQAPIERDWRVPMPNCQAACRGMAGRERAVVGNVSGIGATAEDAAARSTADTEGRRASNCRPANGRWTVATGANRRKLQGCAIKLDTSRRDPVRSLRFLVRPFAQDVRLSRWVGESRVCASGRPTTRRCGPPSRPRRSSGWRPWSSQALGRSGRGRPQNLVSDPGQTGTSAA